MDINLLLFILAVILDGLMFDLSFMGVYISLSI